MLENGSDEVAVGGSKGADADFFEKFGKNLKIRFFSANVTRQKSRRTIQRQSGFLLTTYCILPISPQIGFALSYGFRLSLMICQGK